MFERAWVAENGHPILIAHRGAAALAVENSAQAIALARSSGAKVIEADLRRAADGTFVCLHDPDMMRLAGDPRSVCDLTLDEIVALVPHTLSLGQVVQESSPLGLLLDVKLPNTSELRPMLDFLEQQDHKRRIVIGLRNLELARFVRRTLPAIDILAFAPPTEIESWLQVQPSWFRLWEADATKENIGRVKELGMNVVVMVGEGRDGRSPLNGRRGGIIGKDGFRDLAALGVEAIMLDDPRIVAGPV